MIASTGINDVTPYAPGFLGRYCDAVSGNVAPLSFHLLAGMLVLGSVVGRRAALVRAAGTLYPPPSILLIGPSGTGKGVALALASRVLRACADAIPGFYVGEAGFTVRGIVDHWQRTQRTSQSTILEGAHVEDEISHIVKERTGTENIITWIIRCLAHGDLVDLTGTYGRTAVTGVTVAFGLGSELSYLRRSVSVDEFTGGFMHRFFVAHESEQRWGKERPLSAEDAGALTSEALAIRAAAPPEITLDVGAEEKLMLYRTQARQRPFDSIHLSGYWNRYSTLILRLGALFSIAQQRWVVTAEELERAAALLDSKLYPILTGLISQVMLAPEMKALMDVVDSLVAAGAAGWELKEFQRRTGRSYRAASEALLTLQSHGLVFQKNDRVYGKAVWAVGG